MTGNATFAAQTSLPRFLLGIPSELAMDPGASELEVVATICEPPPTLRSPFPAPSPRVPVLSPEAFPEKSPMSLMKEAQEGVMS